MQNITQRFAPVDVTLTESVIGNVLAIAGSPDLIGQLLQGGFALRVVSQAKGMKYFFAKEKFLPFTPVFLQNMLILLGFM